MTIRNSLFWSVLALGIAGVIFSERYLHRELIVSAVILAASFACGLAKPRLFWVGGLSLGFAKLLADLGMSAPIYHGVLGPLLAAVGPLLAYGSIIAAFRFSLVGSALGAFLGNFLESRAEQLAE